VRKVVLATSIAETSLTIEGVRVVIDSGLARVPRYDPASGLTRLETVRVSRAAADQRRGRAGRTEPGVCYRLWEEAETRGLVPFAAPEMLEADLARLALDLAQWGARDPAALAFLDPPPAGAFAEARALLRRLDALDEAGALTAHGRRLARLPLPPRLAHMVLAGADRGDAPRAALIAAILSERGLGGHDTHLTHRLDSLARDRSRRAEDARTLAARWARAAEAGAAVPGFLPIADGEVARARSGPRRRGESPATPLRPASLRSPVHLPSTAGEETASTASADGLLLAAAYPERIARARGKPASTASPPAEAPTSTPRTRSPANPGWPSVSSGPGRPATASSSPRRWTPPPSPAPRRTSSQPRTASTPTPAAASPPAG
jgi:HrpA-like RNA helicase